MMSQDLFKITPEALQIQLPLISFGTLKSMYEELYQHMRNNGAKIKDAELYSLQRKLTKIQRELNRRHKLGPEFQSWEKKLMTRLKRG